MTQPTPDRIARMHVYADAAGYYGKLVHANGTYVTGPWSTCLGCFTRCSEVLADVRAGRPVEAPVER